VHDHAHADRATALLVLADVRQHEPLVPQAALHPLLESSNLVTSNSYIPQKQNVGSMAQNELRYLAQRALQFLETNVQITDNQRVDPEISVHPPRLLLWCSARQSDPGSNQELTAHSRTVVCRTLIPFLVWFD
jgi:hypothetical protein